MGFEQYKALLKEYFDLCNKYNFKFPWNYEGLMKNPQNIKIDIVRKGILEIRENYSTTIKKTGNESVAKNNKNAVKKLTKKAGSIRLKLPIKSNKKGMHLTVVDLGKRPNKSIIRGKKKSHSKGRRKHRRGGDKKNK